ncbi:MAG: hydroxymethylglutaryl-CoA synthase [Streptococcaceae bacterium]|jgi:hydroxymethylglutaryl-CoA synthase|nr:hydroxymethylglutaryl-CoA synthase [Streptococcaceae bacterium]
MTVGIDKLAFFVPSFVLEMDELAAARGVDPAKFHIGLEIDEMAVNPNTQDIITFAANAATKILEPSDLSAIDLVILGTESSTDESKSGAVILHDLLGIQPFARSVEMKEACYGATAGLLMACDYVSRNPARKALVIASDIARYGLNSAGEPTQGAGAVAMLISENPRLLELDDASVSLTQDVYDFWRPFGELYPRVAGKLSNETYIESFTKVFTEYARRFDKSLDDFAALAFHTPYPKMGKKALSALTDSPKLLSALAKAVSYSRRVGNLYTGSLYLSLISLLENSQTLKAGDTIGLFSYGSGTVSEFFSGQLVAGYEKMLAKSDNLAMLDARVKLSISEYEKMYQETIETADNTPFSIEKIENGIRTYHVD